MPRQRRGENVSDFNDRIIEEFRAPPGGQRRIRHRGTFAVAVRALAGAEREAVWADVVSAVPGVVNTQRKTTRTIPVLLLTRIS
jgi:hypothetical protein